MRKGKQGPIDIVLVDDSVTAREMLQGLFHGIPDVRVVGIGFNGVDAVSLVKRLRPDVVMMDISMPKMDGFEATKQIMREAPTPIVLITSSKVSDDVDLSFKALRAGALTVINKPSLDDADTCSKIVQTVRLMADVPVIHHWRTRDASPQSLQPQVAPSLPKSFDALLSQHMPEIKIVGIAASTGGPSALVAVLAGLPKTFPLPILAVQHITEGFANGLAAWLKTQIRLDVGIAAHGEKLRPGVLYLAPDDYHIQVGSHKTVELTKDAPYKGLRPSANTLFHSMARIYGHRAMGIVLTGMGDDGALGAAALYNVGGIVIAQDEQSSVVYGMPREVWARNAAHQVLSLEQIAFILSRFAQVRASSA